MLVPNQGPYLIELSKDVKQLIKELKLTLQKAGDFLQLNHVKNSSEFENKCTIIYTGGYEFIFKINSILELLHTIGTSQTNKYKYEECFNFMIDLVKFMNFFHGSFYDINDLYIQKSLDLSKIGDNTICRHEYEKHFESKILMMHTEKINILNNNMNQYIIKIILISKIIDTIDI